MKNTKKKKKNKYIFNKITFILFTICNIYLIINILSFVGIEDIIRYIVIVILLLINIIFFIRLKSKNITTSVIMIILSIIFLFISYNANKVLNIINNFSKDKVTYSTSLVTLKENNLKLNTIKTIGILNDETSIDGNILPNKVIKENNYLEIIIAIEELQDKYKDKIKNISENSNNVVWNYSIKDLKNIKNYLIDYEEKLILEKKLESIHEKISNIKVYLKNNKIKNEDVLIEMINHIEEVNKENLTLDEKYEKLKVYFEYIKSFNRYIATYILELIALVIK